MRIVPGASARVKEIFDERRSEAEREAEERNKELRKIPGVAEIDERLGKTGLLILDEISLGSNGIDERIEKIHKENNALIKKRNELVEKNGYAADYGARRFYCKKCRDTGYSGDSMCSCMKAEFAKIALESSGLGALVKKQSFDNFDIEYFDEQYRQRAESNKNICKNYADSFGGECENLLFMGPTGVGKTHLSTAIAKEVINKGYYVLYVSSQMMISDFAALRYGMGNAEDDEKTEKYFNCDLLIIDDLGTEVQTPFAVSVVYNVINSRLCRDKAMIISTNLTPQELKGMYADRITSRLFGNFSPLLFQGRDNRMVIKEKKLKG